MRFVVLMVCLTIGKLGITQSLPKKYAAIITGTSEADVIKILGEPKKIESFSKGNIF
jgi:hypothetical protein